ncbi:MAG: hypothetical protein ACI85U_002602 [Candidatus Promineifilaceae bacterium]|jgi:hypothetical protein
MQIKIGQFLLEELQLKLSEEKTVITNDQSEQARFLGYNITTAWCDSNSNQTRKRAKAPQY